MKHTLAIIGFGGMGGWHHYSIARSGCLRVKGIYDIREDMRRKAAEKGLAAYPSVEEVLADPEVEAVIIATPNQLHRELSIQCLRGGKNVICEKPVTLDAAELEDLIAVRNETGMLFTIHQNRRWDRDYQIVKAILRDREIGNPYFIESRVQGSSGPMHGWRGKRECGGGMLLDWGVHLIDQLLELIPEKVVSVSGALFQVLSGEVDDNSKVFLRFESGISAVAELSNNCFYPLPRWRLSGREGTAVIHDWACRGGIIRQNPANPLIWTDEIVYTAAGPTRTMAPRASDTLLRQALPAAEEGWQAFYQNVADILEGKAQPHVTAEQALRVMRVIDAARKSNACGSACACWI